MKHFAASTITPAHIERPFLYLHLADGSVISSRQHGGEWIGGALQAHFNVHQDEFSTVETDEGEDVFLRGERVAYLVWG